MNVTVLLADHAQSGLGGKMNALGVGWARTGTPLGSHSVILFAEVDESEVEVCHRLTLRLVDEAGNPVSDPSGGPIEAEADLVVNDTFGVAGIAVNIGAGLPLEPGVYAWEVLTSASADLVGKRRFLVVEGAVTPPTAEPSAKQA
ncbi:hypothetical protein [Lentzea sp. HUAS12]|uniref:DUF6941 family protein n=1 Tax=Lentzea sp. HUAS12 TaxID=2951806 RepID=UPI00209E1372|nr:hypothetical protein [Lentzea sp. HUAS12]USX49868.1 hypothetical protein ND450_31300 [Lentzea sp. HUAS12]